MQRGIFATGCHVTEETDHKDSMAMASVQHLTRSSMVLLSMFRASRGGTQKVPYEDLVLQAWKDYPNAFSLRNHPEYPDASDIHKKLYQSLKTNGFVVPLGNKCFRLTESGVERASNLSGKSPSSAAKRRAARLSREEEAFVHHARATRAFQAWSKGRKSDLVDHDARLFFRYGVSTSPKDRRHRVKFAARAIDRARSLRFPDGDALRDLAQYLESSFAPRREAV